MRLYGLREFLTGSGHFTRSLRHFRRAALKESVHEHDHSVRRSIHSAHSAEAVATRDLQHLFDELGTSADGLAEEAAATICRQVGLNDIHYEPPPHWWEVLWGAYFNPFNLLLSVLVVVSLATKDIPAAIMIAAMVGLSTFLRFWQEEKSGRAVEALKALVDVTATVLRAGSAKHEVPIKLLVPGDILLLSAGDLIPADCRIVSAKDLFVSQSALTGEAMPLEKFPTPPVRNVSNPFELDNILFMGGSIVSGSAKALVFATGKHTYFGALSARVANRLREPTAFQRSMTQISWLLVRLTLAMALLVFVANGLTKGDWPLALLFALSVAVGLTPEMLPMIVTTTLAKGAILLSRRKVIVKRLDAIHGFGAMDVLCTDKTGTLTQDKIVLSQHVDAWGEESIEVLKSAYLNSYYQTGLKNLLDVAILAHAEIHKGPNPASSFMSLDEIPFDFNRRRMSVVLANKQAQHVLITKGAVEQVLAVCSSVQRKSGSVPLTASLFSNVKAVADDFNRRGLRVVAVASKTLSALQTTYSREDESALTLVGYIVFFDPPKETAAPALKALGQDGVTVKVLTGDNELISETVCRHVGLDVKGVLLGPALDEMTDAALARAVETNNLFARLTPIHKERVVLALKANGHVVGHLGDGLNDTPALRAADIGISVDSGVDITKETADIILLEKSLMVLEEGVREGRRTFANMRKYIRIAASSNFGNVFSVLVASIFLPFLPMLPLHLLLQNLLYDISQIAIPFDNVDEELLRQPAHWESAEVGRFMLFFGPVSSVFDILFFALLWFVYSANSVQEQSLFQSGWFVAGLITQTLIVHLIRTEKRPFVESKASLPLALASVGIVAVGIFLPMGPLASYFKFQSLPLSYFFALAVIMALYAWSVQRVKALYLGRYG